MDHIYREMIKWRRYFHTYPELGFREYKTQAYIIEVLESLGVSYKKIVDTGIVARIVGKKPGPVIGLRADMDALIIKEKNEVVYQSKNDGCMHACGHDVHMALLLGVAKYYSDHDLENGQIVLLFQPAEETSGGALPMIEAGVIEDYQIDYIFGLHVMPYLEAGMVELKNGQLNASNDEIKITINGKRGHGAYPDKGIDAIVIAASVINGIQTIVSRNISPLNAVAISFGSILGGKEENIICEEVVLKGTMRTLNEETRQMVKIRLADLVHNQCLAYGGEGRVEFVEGYEALINNNELHDIFRRESKSTFRGKSY